MTLSPECAKKLYLEINSEFDNLTIPVSSFRHYTKDFKGINLNSR